MSNDKPFIIIPLIKSSFFQKLIKVCPKGNALREINNLIAKTQDIKTISIENIEAIAFRYKVKIHKKFKNELQEMYYRFLRHCFEDKILSDGELEQLAHLKIIFNIGDEIIDQIHKNVSLEVFNESIDEAIADGKLDKNEKEFLDKLQTRLKLSNDIATNIYSKKAAAYLETCLNSAISDERLSPDEDNELQMIAKNLGIAFEVDKNTKDILDKYRLYWLIENGTLPIVDVDINLQKKEECYFTTQAKWYEYRRVTQRVRYGGPTFKLKIAKGLYWRAGDLGVQTVSNDTLNLIDTGLLYLTNKRIIFTGSKDPKTIQHAKILSFESYNNGIEILKDAGKSPFLEFEKGADIFSMILGRVIREI